MYTIRNTGKAVRVIYNRRGQAVSIAPGASVNEDISDQLAAILSRSDRVEIEGGFTGSSAHTLLDRAGEMTAGDFKDAVTAITGKDYPSKKAAAEDLETLINGG